MNLSINIGRALKHLRKLSGKTQEVVCNETGIFVGNYESGKRLPSIDNIDTLCEYYVFSTGSLFDILKASIHTGIDVENLIEDKIGQRKNQ